MIVSAMRFHKNKTLPAQLPGSIGFEQLPVPVGIVTRKVNLHAGRTELSTHQLGVSLRLLVEKLRAQVNADGWLPK